MSNNWNFAAVGLLLFGFSLAANAAIADSGGYRPLSGYVCTLSAPTGLFHDEDAERKWGDAPLESLKKEAGGIWVGRASTLLGAQEEATNLCRLNYLKRSKDNRSNSLCYSSTCGSVYEGDWIYTSGPGLREILFFETCQKYWHEHPEAMECERVSAPRYRVQDGNFSCRERPAYVCTSVIAAGAFTACAKPELPMDGFFVTALDVTKNSARATLLSQCASHPLISFWAESFNPIYGCPSTNAQLSEFDHCRSLLKPENVRCEAVEVEECLRN
ncbi:MAG: hypothetical protein HY074_12940 [Deltaproteobacteria bacterium]|nr:hypothetical protein [Deltaproteobacteria bacterium]